MKQYTVTLLPQNIMLSADPGESLMELLRRAGAAPDAPCGGQGTCGKCRVLVNGIRQLACQTAVTGDITVHLPEKSANEQILTAGIPIHTAVSPVCPGAYHLAYDIGTTTVACYLLDGQTGHICAKASTHNPQSAFGADVISRIRHALHGQCTALTASIRDVMETLCRQVCEAAAANADHIGTVAVVGNPCMQQLFLGISPENLSAIPFAPVLTATQVLLCREYLPLCENAQLLVVPDISGYVGADTVACLLSCRMYDHAEMALLVDIGTNGEMVLGNRDRMIACSTAAGPALEGANIRFGMRGMNGAIDRVWLEDQRLCCHVIGDVPATGICGSGLVDAVAVMLALGALNERGRIQTPESAPLAAAYLKEAEGQRVFCLTDHIYLTQQDIRQLQLAKGAIAAGIEIMCACMGLTPDAISQVYLAGAFGNAIQPQSAAKIGLIPEGFCKKITAIGNAAGSGAQLLALREDVFLLTDRLVQGIDHLELASREDFQEIFVKNMYFPTKTGE